MSMTISKDRSLTVGGEDIQWIHRREGNADVYFIANTKDTTMTTTLSFALSGRMPEIWNPETGSIETASAWLCYDGKTEVALRLNTRQSIFLVFRNKTIRMNTLTTWNESLDKDVKYFSGTACYTTEFFLKETVPSCRYILDLGKVKNLAVVSVNGKVCANLWRPPFRADITEAIRMVSGA